MLFWSTSHEKDTNIFCFWERCRKCTVFLQLCIVFANVDYVQENYPNPVNEWAVQEAEGSMDKIATRRKKGPYALPLDRIHHQLIRVSMNVKLISHILCTCVALLYSLNLVYMHVDICIKCTKV